ncbi:pyrimidine 5'-nucleotidase [Deferribacter autotrophicus]|uniref:Pyrimidine 5'-nucleotidase n=1 Tax=Deferribacter autotrophicus TaxID=500465 RepID=A0A5A8F8B5_9BACT|nr:pyrimidine 5'-nucleotidase [Deferribacter autotrophicus]KAA0258363.1 pyrimidine 5'-nucleotidase [Deferribacter autotrophicus]
MNEFEYLIFDLDNTLYNPKKNVLKEVDTLINDYMIKKVGIPPNIVNELRKEYRDNYGTTLNGLIKNYSINPNDYLDYVHDIDYSRLIKKDELLLKILREFDQKKIVYTNGSRKHAFKVLKHLGVLEEFDAIYSIEDLDYKPKPFVESFYNFLKKSKVKPEKSLFFEDMEVNLNGAKKIGFKTALVWKKNVNFDYNFDSIYDIIQLKLLTNKV